MCLEDPVVLKQILLSFCVVKGQSYNAFRAVHCAHLLTMILANLHSP